MWYLLYSINTKTAKPNPPPQTAPPGHPAISGPPPPPMRPLVMKSTSHAQSPSLLMEAVLSRAEIYSLCSGEKEESNFFFGVLFRSTFQTLRLVKLIGAFSATGSNVTHLTP